jgi:hypothetical protein
MPVINPDSGTFSDTVTVTISIPTSGASIRYTLDGSDPSESSALYESPIVLSDTTMVKAKAFLEGFLPSVTASAEFTKTAAP